MAGMKEFDEFVGDAKDKSTELIQIGLRFNTFINESNGAVTKIRAAFGKPLDTVTDADVQAYFNVPMTAGQITAAKEFLEVIEDLIQIVKPIRDKLPANDIGG